MTVMAAAAVLLRRNLVPERKATFRWIRGQGGAQKKAFSPREGDPAGTKGGND